MARLDDLITRDGLDNELTGVGGAMWHGTVAHPAPTSVSDPLFVDIPDISILGEVKFGPCKWNNRLYGLTGMALPITGDEVLVVFDNRQQAWVVAIWQ
jgi:hypothetical protein